ncbi:hypothetical protein U0C82_18420 [Fulvimarina sp. 2208YS6-2-32]|uniref:Transporter n=1 Tax=Fulvimarina uroteuthidis TaxID=3098149 RepID=A0ABU5I7F2_9HYPH|nr:hypothetical protein [Fulvimarina sp. 2208YS6-2-32]MDY8111100.1 hypothetical protein [Fulvimarina sp. 2208YS6-2-32]
MSEILSNFSGAFALMAGRRAGLDRLDLSADGFYRSFFAILVAAPALVLSWIEYEIDRPVDPVREIGGAQAFGAHLLADLLSWLLPVFCLILVARQIGWGRKVSPLVVATNWGAALISWAFAPYLALVLAFGRGPNLALLGAVLSLASLVLTARLCHTILGDWATAILVTVAMLGLGIVSYGVVMDLTGVPLL